MLAEIFIMTMVVLVVIWRVIEWFGEDIIGVVFDNAMMIVDIGVILHKVMDATMIFAGLGRLLTFAFLSGTDYIWDVIRMALVALSRFIG